MWMVSVTVTGGPMPWCSRQEVSAVPWPQSM